MTKPIKLSGKFNTEDNRTYKDSTPRNSAMIKVFQAVLDNPNASFESRKTAKDYFAYLAELADKRANYDIDVVNENLMWLGFKGYDIRIEKDPMFNNGELQISVHSKEDEDMLVRVKVPERR
tara:strand:+ start:203 stop:568 length:366 start_codon:yes stop_codon:yes gene_type:complete